MSTRAIWKGVITFADVSVPVKLYSAIKDHSIHFRLLHRKDKAPVKQAMVNPTNNRIVEHADINKSFRRDDRTQVLFTKEDLDELVPEPSREITMKRFVPAAVIDHRWYQRPYYLGPDGANDRYQALVAALEDSQCEGLAHWVMRKKTYWGALNVYQGYLLLTSLHFAEEVLPVADLDAPQGEPLSKRDLAMAQQLIAMLDDAFTPEDYRDEYRARVEKMIDQKAKGGKVRTLKPRKTESTVDLSQALEASLAKKRA